MEKKNGSKRMIACFKFPEEGKSYRKWKKVRHPIRVFRNYIVITLGKIIPDIGFKNRLYRRIGIKIGKNVHIYGTNLDIFFPELLEIGNNCTLGAYSTILTHEFFSGEYRMGKVKIGNNVLICTMCLVLPGVTIGDNSTVAAYSLVNKDVPPNCIVGGVPAKILKKGVKRK